MPEAFPAFWIFRNDQGEWSWQFAAQGGEFTANSSKSYTSQQDCVRSIRALTETKNVAVFGTIDDVGLGPKSFVPAARPTEEAEPLDLTTSQIADGPEEGGADTLATAMRPRTVDQIPTIRNMQLRNNRGAASKAE